MDAAKEIAFLLKGIQHLDSTNILPSRLTLSGNAFPLVRSKQGKVVAAATPYQLGRVACIGHEQLVNKTSNVDDFPRFLCNIFNWLSQKKKTPRIGLLVSSGYQGLEEILLEEDFILTYTSPDKLTAVDVVFANCYSNFIEQEFELLNQFVCNGGGLLVAGENWYTRSIHANDILLDCGIKITKDQAGGNQDYQPHSLSDQTLTQYNRPLDPKTENDFLWKDIQKLDSENLQPSKLEISGDAFPVITTREGDIIAATSSYGSGKITVLGHEDFAVTKGNNDFPSFMINIFRWMSPSRLNRPIKVGMLVPGYDLLYQNLQWHKYQVGLIAIEDLRNVDIIFCDCFTKLTEFQLAKVDKFVSTGGGMIVVGHNWFYKVDHANLILLDCGIDITMTMAGGNQMFTPEYNAFTGIDNVPNKINQNEARDYIMENVKYLNLSNNEPSKLELSSLAVPILESKQGLPIIAASPCGDGKIVAVGHAAYVNKNSAEDDFPVLVKNIFKWLCRDVKREEIYVGLLVSEGYKDLEVNLKEAGFHVLSVNADKLQVTDAIFTDTKKRFSEIELLKVFNFVSCGGGLLVAGDNWYEETNHCNNILFGTGIEITKEYGGSEARVYNVQPPRTPSQAEHESIYGTHTNALLHSVSRLNGEASIASVLELENNAFPIITHHGDVLIAAAIKGKGRVVVMGHESYINRKENHDDFPKMTINMLKWASNQSMDYKVGLLISNYYKGLKGILKSEGINFIDINTDELDSVNVVFADCYTKFSEEALARIHSFVQTGSGLIVAGNNWYTKSTYANNILFGCSIKISQTCGGSLKWTKPESSETIDIPALGEIEERAGILRHVKQVYSRSKVPSILRLAGEAFSLVNMGKGKFVVAGSAYGNGRVIVFGHDEFVKRIDSVGDFPTLVCNAIRWLARNKEKINIGFLVEKGYKDLSVNLISNGFNVSFITTDELDGIDVLFTDCYKRFTKDQLVSLHTFMEEGCGMLIAGQNWEYKTGYANDILQGCGIYITDYYGGTGPLYLSNNLSSVGDLLRQSSDIPSFPLDEVTARKVLFRDVRNLVVGSIQPSVLEVSDRACSLAETEHGDVIIAASTLGQGKIICISHEALVKETISYDDFPLFVLNTFRWLTNEKPAPNIGFLVARDYKNLEKRLSENKFNVSFITTDEIHTSDAILVECYTEYDEGSIINIQSFVRGGGSLLVTGQNCKFKTSFANDVLLGCGIELTTRYGGSNQVLLGTSEPEVSLESKEDVFDKTMIKRKILKFVRKLDATGIEPSELKLSGEAFPLVISRQNLVVAAAAPLGKGKIVVLGHDDFVKKVGDGPDDFPLLVRNIFDEMIADEDIKRVGMLVSVGYDILKGNLTDADMEVTEIKTEELSSVQAIFTDCYTRFDEQQLLHIYSFVTNGGGLLVAGENWFFKQEHANDVLLGCGIKITTNFGGGDQVYEPENTEISDVCSCKYMMIDAMTSKDDILRNITLLDGRGCEPSQLNLSKCAFPLVKSKQGKVVVAGAPFERGQVVVFGHEAFVKKTGEADDFPLLLQNIFHWMVRGKDPATVGLLSSQGYKSLEDNLNESGFKVIEVTTETLEDADAIFVDSYTRFNEKQLLAIHTYLRKGHGLVVAGHNWFFKHEWVNDVLLGSGIKISADYGGGNQIYALESNFEKEYPIVLKDEYISEVSTKAELFRGVRRLEAYEVEPSTIKTCGDAFPLIMSKEGKAIAAVATCGSGRIAALGHEELIERRQSAWNDFPKFVNNICKWLANSHGQKFGFLVPIAGYKRFRNNLRSARFTVSAVTPDQLSTVDVIYADIYTKFDAKELRKIRSFVTNGGGLLVAGQNWHFQREFANDILFDSGIIFTKSQGGGRQVYVPRMPYVKPSENIGMLKRLFCCMM